MNKSDIKFFEIEYNWKDNLNEEKRTAIVTNAEYNPKTFPTHIDEKIFHYDLDEYYLGVLVNLGSVTYQDFIVYSFKEVASVLEDTNKLSSEDVENVANSINKKLTAYQIAYILTHYHLYENSTETWDLTIEQMIYEIIEDKQK